jgi:hypothetical protein
MQLHTLEDMTLKVKRTHLEDGCAVNTGATLMGGAVIERNTTLYPLSLVLKEMNMVTGTYEGSPAQPVNDATLLSRARDYVAASVRRTHSVDSTDWLKTFAIILVLVDHIGYFFIENDQWWSVFGRLAAPTFFFLLGYAHSRGVPLNWIWLGLILTVLDLWHNEWKWVAPNILLSFALIRLGRPYAQGLLERHGWVGFALIAALLFALLPVTAQVVDYGAEGWLWALFGLSQRLYVDDKSTTSFNGTAQISAPPAPAMKENTGLMRLLACFAAVVAYVWQEQSEYSFPQIQFAVFIFGIGVWSASLCLFLRGPSRIQPPEAIAGALRFIGRHTLEIYAIQLAGSELLVKLVPDLAP